MGVGYHSLVYGRRFTGEVAGATSNCIWFVGPWIGLVGDLGCLRNGERHDANRCGVGIFIHGCLVAGRWCKSRQRRGQLNSPCNWSNTDPSGFNRTDFLLITLIMRSAAAQGKRSVLAWAYLSAHHRRHL